MYIFCNQTLAALSATLLLVLGTIANAQDIRDRADDPDVPMATGEHWTTARENGKLAYLLGMANFLEIEQALQQDNPPAQGASMVPVMISGLSDMTLNEISEALDRWYAANPNRLGRPVLETIYFELARPNSQSKR